MPVDPGAPRLRSGDSTVAGCVLIRQVLFGRDQSRGGCLRIVHGLLRRSNELGHLLRRWLGTTNLGEQAGDTP